MPSIVKIKDFSNLEYPKLGAGIGVFGAIAWSISKRYGLGKTALVTLLTACAGAYVGYQYDNHFNK